MVTFLEILIILNILAFLYLTIDTIITIIKQKN